MILYSQRDPRWAGHPLGWGPALGTIGQYGCFDSVLAMIATDTGHVLNPAQLDEYFTAAKIFVRDPTGTFDLLPDDALAEAFPGRYAVSSFAGFRGDLIRAAVPSPDAYAVLWISTPSVPTHFVLAAAVDGLSIIDPWTGSYGRLAGYGGPAAVHKTVLVKVLAAVPPVAPVPVPTPTPPPQPPAPPPTTAPVNPPLVSPPPFKEVPPVASNPPVPPVDAPPEPEPAPVAEAGITTSEWKLALGFLAQGAAIGTADLVNAVAQAVWHVSVTVPAPLLQLLVDLEFAGAFVGGAYIVSRGIRKFGTGG